MSFSKRNCVQYPSLPTTDSVLRPTNKADLATILQAGAKETELSPSVLRTCTIIDGMALVRAIGTPLNPSIFVDYADVFTQRVTSYLHVNITRVDLFDQYQQNSIKSGTRANKLHQQLGWMFLTYRLHMKKRIPAYCYMQLMQHQKGIRAHHLVQRHRCAGVTSCVCTTEPRNVDVSRNS